jgi:hypothetical protein
VHIFFFLCEKIPNNKNTIPKIRNNIPFFDKNPNMILAIPINENNGAKTQGHNPNEAAKVPNPPRKVDMLPNKVVFFISDISYIPI